MEQRTDEGLDALRLEEEPEEPRRVRTHRGRRRVIIAVLVLFGLALASAIGFVGYLGSTVERNVQHEDLLPPAAQNPVKAPDGSTIPTSGTGTNFLVIGTDGRTPTDRGRSDVIVIVHVPEDPTTIQMIHFPRDLYVSIPGHGKNKINAAYAFGGEQLLVRTLQNMLGIHIDHVARTNFDGFKNMTDAVGGVRVYAEEGNDAGGNGGIAIHKGWNELNGEQALGFVRERHELSEGDISRGRRQLAFIKALLLKVTSPETVTNPVKIAKFTNAATENLVVDQDLTVGEMKDYAIELKGIRGNDVVFATAPYTGFASDPVAGSIDVVDQERMDLLGQALRKDQMDDYLDVFQTP